MDEGNRAFSLLGDGGRPGEHHFRWGRAVAWMLVAAVPIGAWLFMLASIAIAEVTRGETVLFHPSNMVLAVATLFMLLGVALLSIQVVAVVNYLMHGHGAGEH